ncbi:hypothetical protein WH47_04082 [Habropoda laboriosa]|uniref:Uncharacterized protein n=1 Tax=Habropoda laboriosa TaxID=597456 RepID=A0A0L7QJL4_9HYME|nr:hypothetical protein WH47_04082 [Habropoda laboriosa]
MPKFSNPQPTKPTSTKSKPHPRKGQEPETGIRNDDTRRTRGLLRVNATTGRLINVQLRSRRGATVYLLDTGAGINLVKEGSVNARKHKIDKPKIFHMGRKENCCKTLFSLPPLNEL